MHTKVAVVTGASAGVGRAIARAFGAQGTKAALVARGTDGLEAAAREIRAMGSVALPMQANVSNADQVESAATRTELVLGPIDCWINNAMVSVFSPVTEMSASECRA